MRNFITINKFFIEFFIKTFNKYFARADLDVSLKGKSFSIEAREVLEHWLNSVSAD